MAKIAPLNSKFYGTKVETLDGGLITVWEMGPHPWKPSQRELENNWEPEYGFDHVETEHCYTIASIICDALTKKGF